MAEKIKEIFDRINQKNGLLDQIQQKYLIFNGQGQSDFNAVDLINSPILKASLESPPR